MRAYGKNIILKPVKQKDTTDSGLYIPNGAGDTKNIAEVVDLSDELQVGPAVIGLQIGQHVIFSSGKSFSYEGQEYIVCKLEEVLVTF